MSYEVIQRGVPKDPDSVYESGRPDPTPVASQRSVIVERGRLGTAIDEVLYRYHALEARAHQVDSSEFDRALWAVASTPVRLVKGAWVVILEGPAVFF